MSKFILAFVITTISFSSFSGWFSYDSINEIREKLEDKVDFKIQHESRAGACAILNCIDLEDFWSYSHGFEPIVVVELPSNKAPKHLQQRCVRHMLVDNFFICIEYKNHKFLREILSL